ncbi:DUF1146 family protein [Loigolactobacillus backii]|uniref:DUF1146 family protein n=2 Tax=Loigolactobacillus backii TaxID=375175 RepID=UPI000B086A3D|nr:DUF1146 family protein [Loigolactobacillus backii]
MLELDLNVVGGMDLQNIGIQSVVTLVCYFIFTGAAFWALRALRFEKIIRRDHVQQAQLLVGLLAIVIGYLCSTFFLNFIDNARNLIFLFR